MKLKEKKKRALKFMSEKLTWADYVSIQLFSFNEKTIISLIELEGVVLKKIEKDEIKHNMPDDYLLRVKHFILLDALAKIMMLIEGVLVLCAGLSECKERKRRISLLMARYETKQINEFIERFKNNSVNLWKLASLPSLEKLQENCGLTAEERENIRKLLDNSCNAVKNTLKALIDFYEKNKILYWKFKHGLSIIAGFKLVSQPINDLSSISWAIDRLPKKPSSVCVETTLLQPELIWFNTISILPYSEKTFKHYSSILSDLRNLVRYVVNNRILWAINCGEDYFPMEKQPNGLWAPTVYTIHNGSNIWKKCESIIPKITSNTHVIDSILNFTLDLKGKALENVVECLQHDSVATIWSPQSLAENNRRKH
jgi:hypothetical protein